MIVYTATNKTTNEVYVGSARDSMEEQWARLIVQAEEGGSGEFLSSIREFGADNFEVTTWAYADSSSEARELVRDACEEFSAKLIKTGRAPAPTMAASQESTSTTPQHGSSDSLSTKVTAILSQGSKPSQAKQTKAESSAKPVEKKLDRQVQKEHGPVTSIDVNAYLASQEKESKEKESKKADVVSLRQTDSTKDFDDMKSVMMRIEMKRRQNRTTSTTSKSTTKSKSSSATKSNSSSATASLTSKKSKTGAVKDKLPDGRVSSSAKEKRIKEAIAKEKMEREAAQAAKAAAEAKEMAEIMARLDQRSKEKESIRRRR